MTAQHVTFCEMVLKGVREDLRQITGIATTGSMDRHGEILDIASARFRPEVPLIWQHQQSMPAIGRAQLFKDGDAIRFVANFAKLTEPGLLKERADLAWQAVKSGLVKFVSIGAMGGRKFVRKNGPPLLVDMEVVELSPVTVPANADATIDTVKALYARQRESIPLIREIDLRFLKGAIPLDRS
ncbi:HK97 family phage prohead protease [Pseudorhodoferax soli]|uniref:Prohead serine protease n=1 Tax=Pseudorhodoferax soli TaxID=545864 RepID=A0A368Y269_9BURK|nr:HK97 family phage prohead protease [Pseudorhodoferax soli]RCW73819.1 prohead serine protease [Pseudorhodoferax soli]